jgi:AbrB family looped-hinge helix DNA binding protein
MPEPNERVSAVKIGASRQVVIPKRAFDALGLAPGDYFEVRVQRGSLILTPKTLVDKTNDAERKESDGL